MRQKGAGLSLAKALFSQSLFVRSAFASPDRRGVGKRIPNSASELQPKYSQYQNEKHFSLGDFFWRREKQRAQGGFVTLREPLLSSSDSSRPRGFIALNHLCPASNMQDIYKLQLTWNKV